MSVFLGIDGGGTRTRAFVVDEFGSKAGLGEAGLSNPNHASAAELLAHLQQAIQLAFAKAGLSTEHCTSAFAGMAGVTTTSGRARIEEALVRCSLGQARIGVDHDIRIALAGGLAGKPGIALIVGTGSSCYGRNAEGRTWQTGGWEALISDEGSAYHIGREAIAAAARMADGRTPDSPLRARVFEWLGIGQISEILPRIHDRGLSRSDIAAFAPNVISLASESDEATLAILDRGAVLLGEMVSANHRMLPTGPGPDVVITGGLGTADTIYRAKIVRAIQAQLPSANIHHPQFAPVIGAAMLAMQQVAVPVSPGLVGRLQPFSRVRVDQSSKVPSA